MLRVLIQIVKWMLLSMLGLLLLAVGILMYLYYTADLKQPNIQIDTHDLTIEMRDSVAVCGGSTLRRNSAGLWELTTGGDALQRGTESGVLMRDLLHYQEQTFVAQIRRIIPSDRYLRFLRAFIVIFNHDIARYVSDEYRTEIYALSHSCSHKFDAFGQPYERQLNYHAAHDIGHAMQEYMLVGCSSFATWGAESADSTLLVGRNFDFWVGDDFARNKLVTFCRPELGYAFASVGWAGMAGVLSGMNDQGLTVTINAAKGSMPLRAATPISLLARTILQYSATIDEAYAIADSCRTFVSESLLIASARDGRAAIIEKTPAQTALYTPDGCRVVCTNHYQSALLAGSEANRENIATTDSYYRFQRLGELLDQRRPLTPIAAADVLRDRYGMGGKDIGLSNEKSLNQAIAHHAVIFQPEKGRMWVSTDPWQAGAFVCYDLKQIFSSELPTQLGSSTLTIPADERFLNDDYPRVVQYRADVDMLREAMKRGTRLEQSVVDRIQTTNPHLFATWNICGDYFLAIGDADEARRCWAQALQLEIPRENERRDIESKLER